MGMVFQKLLKKREKDVWKMEVIDKNKFDYIDWLGDKGEILTILEIEYFTTRWPSFTNVTLTSHGRSQWRIYNKYDMIVRY